MSYKIKSLVYLICFIASAILYYTTLEESLPKPNSPVELAEADTQSHTNENDLLQNTK